LVLKKLGKLLLTEGKGIPNSQGGSPRGDLLGAPPLAEQKLTMKQKGKPGEEGTRGKRQDRTF